MSIEANIKSIKSELPPMTKLVAVSKFKPSTDIMEAYNAGQRDFAESRPQEFKEKAESLPKDIIWHFIGHIQTNKVKMVIPYASLIHSVDSIRLLREINKEGAKLDKEVNILLQFHIAKEESKQGFSMDDIDELMDELSGCKFIKVNGVMGMATFTDDSSIVKDEFMMLKGIFNELKSKYFEVNQLFTEISMGMSQDYHIAIDCGSTMVRIGSHIFGERVY